MLRLLYSFLILLFTGFLATAQPARSADGSVHYVNIGVNGLHCSACTYSVEKSIRKLDFVRLVKMDLNERAGTIYFEESATIDYEQLAKAVFDAGFSVRSFIIVFDGPLPTDKNCIGDQFCIVKKEATAKDRIQIIGKGFLEKKVLKEMNAAAVVSCECEGENILRAVLL